MADGTIKIGIELEDSGVTSKAQSLGSKAGNNYKKGFDSSSKDTGKQAESAIGKTGKDAGTTGSKAGKEFASGFEAQSSKIGDGVKSALSNVAKIGAAAAAAGAAGVAALGKAALDAYAQYEQLVGGVDTLFKESSALVQEYAANAYKTAGVSANSYMEQATAFSASLIQSLGGDTQEAAEYANQAIIDMSDNANKMGTSIETIQDTYQSLMRGNYAMLDNLKLGYGGTKAELERLVEDASVLTGQALDPNKFSDVITAIHAVQENLGITGTTAEEAATTIEGSVNMMKASWENWLAGLGNEEADMGALTEQLVESVTTAASNVIPRIGEIASSLGDVIVQYLPGAVATIQSSLSSLLPEALQTPFNDAFSGLGEVFSTIFDTVQSLIEPMQGAAESVFSGISAGLESFGAMMQESLIPAIQLAQPAMEQFLNAIAGAQPVFELLGSFIGTVAGIIATVFVEAFIIAVNILTVVINAITSFVTFLMGVPASVGEFFTGVTTWFSQLPGAISGFLANVISSIAAWAVDLGNKAIEAGQNFLNGVNNKFNEVVSFFSSIPGMILGALGDLGSLLWDAGQSVVQGFKDGISAAWEGVTGFISGLASGISIPLPFSAAPAMARSASSPSFVPDNGGMPGVTTFSAASSRGSVPELLANTIGSVGEQINATFKNGKSASIIKVETSSPSYAYNLSIDGMSKYGQEQVWGYVFDLFEVMKREGAM